MTEKTCYTRIFNTVIPELFKRRMKRYYEEEFAEQPDLLSVLDVANLTGYSKMFIGKLIQEGKLRSVTASRVRYALRSKYVVKDCPPPSGKDYNDYLKQKLARTRSSNDAR